jgi:hypothetical protein
MTNDPKPDCAEYWFAGVFGGIVRPSPFDPGLESGATAGPSLAFPLKLTPRSGRAGIHRASGQTCKDQLGRFVSELLN